MEHSRRFSSSYSLPSSHAHNLNTNLFSAMNPNRNELLALPWSSSFHGSNPQKVIPLITNLPEENNFACDHEKEEVMVALRINLPDNSSDSANSNENESAAGVPNHYWIPTQEQILICYRHFSCPVFLKTFNRYNNLQTHMWGHGSEYRKGTGSLKRAHPRPSLEIRCCCCSQGCKNNIEYPTS